MLQSLGLLGLFLGCALAATVVPFSSEAMLAAALLTDYNRWVVVLVATCGNTVGGMVSYAMGWLVKWDWLERWFRVKRERLECVSRWTGRYGVWAALLTWLPVVGDVIAIAMGLMRTNPWLTVLLMFIGKMLRYAAVAGLLGMTGIV